MKRNNINMEMMLSENFRLGEFTEHEKARLLAIDNTPSWEVVFHLRQLCREVLQPLRDHYGRPIIVTSGYRCPELNEAVHGVGGSQHLYGCAADLHLPDIDTGRQWYYWMVNHLDFDQLLLEYNRSGDRWLHVSHQPDYKQNRHIALFNYLTR